MGVRYIPCLGFRSEVQASSPLGRRRYSLRPNLNPKPYTLNPWTLTSIADSAPAQQAFLEVANAPCQCLRGRGRGRGRACTIPRISVGGIPQQSACDGQRYARLFSATSVTSAGFGTDAGVHSSSGSHSVPACATTRNAAPAVTCVCVCVCARARAFPCVGMAWSRSRRGSNIVQCNHQLDGIARLYSMQEEPATAVPRKKPRRTQCTAPTMQ